MTGNTKVWRASLAGLASFAMVATMGVAAASANAADVTFTFNGNGLTFNVDGEQVDTYTVKDDGDGKLDSSEIKAAMEKISNADVISGWFTTAEYGVADTAVQPDVTTATTVYAHWSEDSLYTVNFAGASVVSASVKLAQKNGNLDRVASWQVPGDKATNDGWLLTGWKNGAQTTVDPTADLATSIINGGKTINLTSTEVSSHEVTFSNQDLWSEDGRTVLVDGKDEALKVEVASGATTTAPTAVFEYADKTVEAKDWVTAKDKKTKFDASKPVTANATYYAATLGTNSYTVTFTTGDTKSGYSEAPKAETVAEGKTVAEPTAPTLKKAGATYEFAGWYTADGKKFDFNTAVNGNVVLQARFKVTAVDLTFKAGFIGGKDQTVSVKDGDTLTAPKVSRDGYVFNGWDTSFPEGSVVVLKSDAAAAPTASILYRMSSGEGVDIKDFTSRTFTAQWAPASAASETLTGIENRVTVLKDGKYISGSDQSAYTAESFDQYVKDFQAYLKDKEAAAKDDYTVGEYSDLIQELKGIQAKLVEVADTTLYRLYNANNGDHYYTANVIEAQFLQSIGWKNETGTNGYKVVKSSVLGTAVYSVYNPNTGEHLLTASATEAEALKAAGWNWDNGEQAVFYAPQGATKAVYRIYNPNTNGPAHHYAGQSEAAKVVSLGWKWDNNAQALFYFG